jgi:DNA-binding MarR family transcriptional regulator
MRGPAVPGKIRAKIAQTRPFASLAEETFLNVVRTADRLVRTVDLLLRRHGLTFTQYNVLRILRGAGDSGANGRDIAGRTINPEPDITRLLDRMEKRGLIRRCRHDRDRRFVTAWITGPGLEILAALDEPVARLHREQFAALSKAELKKIVAGLEKARSSPVLSQPSAGE